MNTPIVCRTIRTFIWDQSQLWNRGIENSFPKKRKYWCIDFTDCTQIQTLIRSWGGGYRCIHSSRKLYRLRNLESVCNLIPRKVAVSPICELFSPTGNGILFAKIRLRSIRTLSRFHWRYVFLICQISMFCCCFEDEILSWTQKFLCQDLTFKSK